MIDKNKLISPVESYCTLVCTRFPLLLEILTDFHQHFFTFSTYYKETDSTN